VTSHSRAALRHARGRLGALPATDWLRAMGRPTARATARTTGLVKWARRSASETRTATPRDCPKDCPKDCPTRCSTHWPMDLPMDLPKATPVRAPPTMAKRLEAASDLSVAVATARASASDPRQPRTRGRARAARSPGRCREGCGAFARKSARERPYSGRKSTGRTSTRLAAARFLDLPAVDT
jgi:hypothetical protein